MLIVLKLGGSVITDRASMSPKPDMPNLRRLAHEIAGAWKAGKFGLVVVHGAGSYGHQIVKRTGIDKGIQTDEQRQAFAETQKQVNELNIIVCEELQAADLPAVPCQASAAAVMNNGRIAEWDIGTVNQMLACELIPVLYGVPAVDKSRGCSILSGDQIAPYIAKKLGANMIIHGTDVDGVFTADPKKDPSAKLIPEVNRENLNDVLRAVSGSGAVDVTGGMAGKLKELVELGVPSRIVSANLPGRVAGALMGESVGTFVRV